MLEVWLEGKDRLRSISKSILGLCNYDIKSGLFNLYITIVLQLRFFLNVSLVKCVGV